MSTRIITFYSFKGGVGRTQALANVAVALANRGRDVIALDFDLESPGLHCFFTPSGQSEQMGDEALRERRGLLDFLEECQFRPEEAPQAAPLLLECDHARRMPGHGRLRLMPAGSLDADYARRVGSFSWSDFYESADGYRFLELLRKQLLELKPDFVLIDSRTGMTDVAQVCTFQLPEELVVLFALHQQGVEGARRIGEAVRKAKNDPEIGSRLERVLFVASRVDEFGPDAIKDYWLQRARLRLADLDGNLLLDLGDRIPYSPQAAFGENIVVQAVEANPLSTAYERLVDRFASNDEAVVDAVVEAGFEQIAAELRVLLRDVESTVATWRDFHAPKERIGRVSVWAHGLSQASIQLPPRAAALARRLAPWMGYLGVPEPESSSRLESFDDVVSLGVGLKRTLDDLEGRLDQQRVKFRERLAAAAEGEDALAAEEVAILNRLLRRGRIAEIDARIAEAEVRLRTSNRKALLKRGELDDVRLANGLPDEGARALWIRARLEEIVEAGALDEQTRLQIDNLLRLALQLPVERPPILWSAYEILCLLVREAPEQDDRCFRGIGVELWRREWQRSMEGAAPASDDIAGPDTTQQLARQATRSPEKFESLAQEVADLLAARSATAFVDCFRKRHTDPLLRSALEKIALGPLPADVRRRFCGAWLYSCDDLEKENAIIRGFILALVEEGYAAEAYESLAVFTRRYPAIHDTEVNAIVQLAIIVRALDSGMTAVAVDVAAAGVETFLGSRAGRLFVALLGGGWLSGVPDLGSLEADARSRLLHGGSVPPDLRREIAPWLQRLERGSRRSVGSVAEVRDRLENLNDLANKKFYASWAASIWYEEDFHSLVVEWRERLLEARGRAQEIGEEIAGLDAARWVRDSYERQRAQNRKTNRPEGGALTAMQQAFVRLRSILEDLNQLRGADQSLRDMLLEADEFEQAARAMRAEVGQVAAWRAQQHFARWAETRLS